MDKPINQSREWLRMLLEPLDDAGEQSPEDVYRQYRGELARIVEEVGPDRTAEETGIAGDRVDALLEGESDLTLEEAAEILALTPEYDDADTVLRDVRDQLLMRMSSAVVDVDAISTGIDLSLSGQEIQQKIEGRAPMTLEEYARILHYIESNNPYR